jgi:hypothetical protein
MKNLYKITIKGIVSYMFSEGIDEALDTLKCYGIKANITNLIHVCSTGNILNIDAFVKAENEESEALVKEAIKKIENKSFKK